MPDDHITSREFDGYAKAMRDNFDKVGSQVTQVLTLLDTLLKGRIEEARAMGEITEAIRSINQRLERQEGDVINLRAAQETEAAALREQVGELWDHNNEQSKGQLKWWGQVAIVIVSVVIGAIATRLTR